MLIDGNKNARNAKIIPKDDNDKRFINGSSPSISKSLWAKQREDFSLNLLFTKCFDFE